MVRYPHKATLVTPVSLTWVKGKAVPSESKEPTLEVIDCEVQVDSSNLTQTINGKSIVSQYRLYFADLYQTTKTAKTVIFENREYNILECFLTGHGYKMKIG